MNRELTDSRLAVLVLQDTNRARDSISQQNDSLAKQCVKAALNAINRINEINGVAATTPNRLPSNLVPIYAEFSQVTVWSPITTEQQRRAETAFNRNSGINDQSQSQSTEASETGQASREAPEDSPQPPADSTQQASADNTQQPQYGQHPAIQGVTQNFSSILLDVNSAKTQLDAANDALQNNNMAAADDALAAVQNGVTLVSIEADQPLVQARQNLALARDLAEQGRVQEMGAPLHAAADALDSYAAEGTAHAGDAAALARQMRSDAAKMTGSANRVSSSTVQRLDNWWGTTTSWSSSSQPQ